MFSAHVSRVSISIPRIGDIPAKACNAKVFGMRRPLWPVYVEESGQKRLVVVRALMLGFVVGDLIVDKVPEADAEACLAASHFFPMGGFDFGAHLTKEQTETGSPERNVKMSIKMNTKKMYETLRQFPEIMPESVGRLSGLFDHVLSYLNGELRDLKNETVLYASWYQGKMTIYRKWEPSGFKESVEDLSEDKVEGTFSSLAVEAEQGLMKLFEDDAMEFICGTLAKHTETLTYVHYQGKLISDPLYSFPDSYAGGR